MDTLIAIGLWNAAASAVLALLAAAVSRLGRRPALAHTLWLLVLLKLVTPPLVPFSLSWPAAESVGANPPVRAESAAPLEEPVALAAADEEPVAADVPADPAWESPPVPEAPPVAPAAPFPWRSWAGVVWLAGSSLWVGWVALHVVRFRRALRHARPAPAFLQGEADTLARRLGLRRCPEVRLVPGAVSPMVWALGRRPRLLFPSGLLDRLGAEGRAALLAHELAHVRRRDHWVRLLELAATGLYWWNPVLWWARRELHEAEEQCCDAWGVWAVGGDGRPYALALLQAVAFVSRARLPLPAGASGGVGQLSHLKRRLEMVMQGKTSRSLSWAGLGVVFGVGLLLLPLFPARGQAPPPGTTAAPDPRPAGDGRDQDIETLKRALKILEAERERERAGRTGRVADDTKGNELMGQLKDLERQIAAKRKELDELERKAQDLRAKLGVVPARPGLQPPGSLDRPPSVPPGERRRGDLDRTDPAAPPPRTREGRVEDLEQKLDRLQKELEELRRELRRGPGRTSAEPLTPPPVSLPRDPGGRALPAPLPPRAAAPGPAPRDPNITPPAGTPSRGR
jgi:beta-lactamase regulating signal transducer with metallopeptidase domain